MAVLIDSYPESNNGSIDVSVGGSGTVSSDGQTFSVGPRSMTLDSAKFYVKKGGTPTGSCYARVYAMTGVYGSTAIPTGSALAVSDAVDVSTLGTSYALHTFTFSGANRITLSSTGRYFVCFEFAGGDYSNYAVIAPDTTSPTHSGNNAWKAGGGWTYVASQDLVFYIYGIPADETLVLIDGYEEWNCNTTGSSYSGASAQHDGNSFANTNAIKLTNAYMLLAKTGSPTGTIVAKLWTHTGTYGGADGKPGTLLATSDTVDVSTLAAYSDSWSLKFVEFTFSGDQIITLSAATKYCITIEYAAGNSSNYVRTGLDSTSPTHGGRRQYSTNGSSWTAQSGVEFCFYVYGSTGWKRDLADNFTLQDNNAGRMLSALDSQFLLSETFNALINRLVGPGDSMTLLDAVSVAHYDSWKKATLHDELVLIDQREVVVEEVPTLETLPVAPSSSMEFGVAFVTDVIGPSADGTEQRVKVRDWPVFTMSYSLTDLGDRDARILASLLHHAPQDWEVPFWALAGRSAAATTLDGGRVYVNDDWAYCISALFCDSSEDLDGLYLMFWSGPQSFEVRKAVSRSDDINGTYITLEDGPGVWPSGTLVIPCLLGKLTKIENEERVGPLVRSAKVTFETKGLSDVPVS